MMSAKRKAETAMVSPPETAALDVPPLRRETSAEATARATLARIKAAEESAKTAPSTKAS